MHPNYMHDLFTGIIAVLKTEFANDTPSGHLHMRGIRKTAVKQVGSGTIEVSLFAEGNPIPAVFTVKVTAKRK